MTMRLSRPGPQRVFIAVLTGLLGLPVLPLPVAGAGYTTARAVSGPWQARSQAYGRVRARAESRIELPFPVRLTWTGTTPGQAVTRGETLLRFAAPALAQALIAYASARHDQAASAARLALLRSNEKQRTVTRRDVAVAELDLARVQGQASAAWARLQADLAILGVDWTRRQVDEALDGGSAEALAAKLGVLRAPFAGVVVTRAPAVGVWVDANTPLLELEDLTEVYVAAGVPESALSSWHGGETEIVDEAAPISLVPLPGAPGMDPSSGLRLLRYRAANPAGHLRDGQWVQVMHRGTVRSVAWVPASAVAGRNGRDWCLVVKGGKPEPVPVRVGPQQDGRIPVLEGLEAGQEVVTEGAYELLYRDLKDLIQFVD